MKKLTIILIIVIMSMLLTVSVGLGCYELINAANSPEALFAREMGVGVKRGFEFKRLANSVGFFGDGQELYEITVPEGSEAAFLEWSVLPLSQKRSTDVTGILNLLDDEARAKMEPFFSESGYWKAFDRSSTSFSVCVYDAESNIAYYFRSKV